MVEVERDATKLTVIEGKVSSESVATRDTRWSRPDKALASGRPGRAITTVIKPQDAVQWVLRYPPLSDGSNASRLELLGAGSVDEALVGEVDAVLRRIPAIAMLMLFGRSSNRQNDRLGALASAKTATTTDAGNYRAWLALSYSQQATFDLDTARLKALARPRPLNPSSSLTHSAGCGLPVVGRHASGQGGCAGSTIAGDPQKVMRTACGFVHLAQIDTVAARRLCGLVGEIHLVRYRGWGSRLAMIRDGELVARAGANRKLRWRLISKCPVAQLRGQAYYGEHCQRDDLAGSQLQLASALDHLRILRVPLQCDPAAVSRTDQSMRCTELWESIKKKMTIVRISVAHGVDDDAASQGFGRGRHLFGSGIRQLGILESAQALAENVGNHSAHRQLASAYAKCAAPRYCEVSEALQAQIRQPDLHSSSQRNTGDEPACSS